MGMLADIYTLSMFEIRVIRMKCELKAEEMAMNRSNAYFISPCMLYTPYVSLVV
jgi:hypothetical protein